MKKTVGRQGRLEKLERRSLVDVMPCAWESWTRGGQIEELGRWCLIPLVIIHRHRLLTGEGGSSFSARRIYFIFELSDSGADV